MPFLTKVTPLWDRSTLTLAELAEKCNISESSASRYLNGKIVPPADIAERILEVLGADIVTTPTPEEKPQAAIPPVLQIWEVYKEEIDILQANHANHIAEVKGRYVDQIADLKRDKRHLHFTVLIMFCLIVYLMIDGFSGNWGIFQYPVH